MSLFEKRDDQRSLEQPVESSSPGSEDPEGREPSKPTAMIGETMRIKGVVTGEEDLVIDGYVDGTVQLKDNDLVIGSSGKVHADVSADAIKIDGEVRGDIAGMEKVVITKSGRVEGNIISPEVSLEAGAKFKGSIEMDSPSDHVTSSARPVRAPKSVPAAGAAKDETGEATA